MPRRNHCRFAVFSSRPVRRGSSAEQGFVTAFMLAIAGVYQWRRLKPRREARSSLQVPPWQAWYRRFNTPLGKTGRHKRGNKGEDGDDTGGEVSASKPYGLSKASLPKKERLCRLYAGRGRPPVLDCCCTVRCCSPFWSRLFCGGCLVCERSLPANGVASGPDQICPVRGFHRDLVCMGPVATKECSRRARVLGVLVLGLILIGIPAIVLR